jgi:RNA polymerase sigma-70 factor, ECF subfamily
LWEATPAGPEARYAARQSVQLAFIVTLQHLPPTQRAVLILREVLGWSAVEVAELLDTSVASVNSALQRARATLDERGGRPPKTRRPDDPAVQELLRRYLAAWEASDVSALVGLLHEDVIVSMPPVPAWLRGSDAMARFMPPRIGPPGTLRLIPIPSAEDAAFALYRCAPGGTTYDAHAIQTVRIDGARVVEIHAFLQPALFPRFGLPMQLPKDR